jgi:hypothetical protein
VLGGGDLEEARVVSHQGHVAQVQGLQELGLQTRYAAWREIGVRSHGIPVTAEGQRRHDAAVVTAQLADDVAPQRAVHRESVKQDEEGAVAARILILDDSRRQLGLRHGHTSSDSYRSSAWFLSASAPHIRRRIYG